MRYLALIAMGCVAFAMGTAGEAAAFGDRCYAPVKETGEASTYRGAMAEARKCWEAEVRSHHGARAANWYYSADRRFDCSWNANGTWFKCVATAAPCEQRY